MRKLFSWPVIATTAAILCSGTLVMSAQTDLSGYWAFRIKDGGVNYYNMEQQGEVFRTVPQTGGRGGGGGRGGLVGTVKNGKVHLEVPSGGPPPGAPAAAGAAPA